MFGKLVPGNIKQNPLYVENQGNWYSYFSHSMGPFFPLDSHSIVHFIICEIHGFPPQFSIAIHRIGRVQEIGTHFFPNLWILFFRQIPILWYILLPQGKCMVFPIKIHSASSLVVFRQCYFFYLFQNLLISKKKKQKSPLR